MDDQHWIPPSPVVHVRGLGKAVVEADLVEALQEFGKIWYEPYAFRVATYSLTLWTKFYEIENVQALIPLLKAEIGAACKVFQQVLNSFLS